MATCSIHGTKIGVFKKCGLCEQSKTLLTNLNSKTPIRPIDEPDDD